MEEKHHWLLRCFSFLTKENIVKFVIRQKETKNMETQTQTTDELHG